mgnify:CR=1 FL=1
MSKTKKSLLTFLGLCFSISLIFYYLIIAKQMLKFSYLLMWCPGIAAIITSLIYHRKENALLIRRTPLKYIGITFLLTFVWWGISYGVYFLLYGRDVIIGNMPLELAKQPAMLLMMLVIYFVTALGEELGWRGYMGPKLNELFGFYKGGLICGLIWALWHAPLFLTGYVSTIPLWYQAPIYVLQMVVVSYTMSYLTLKSKSVWPAVFSHFLDNFVCQVLLDQSIGGPLRPYLVGETGIISLLMMVIVAAIVIKLYNNQSKVKNFDLV